jgi:cell division cycle 14
LEGDLHEVVPGKLIAFKGPRTLSHSGDFEDIQGCRHFAPQFYADIFADEMHVSTVIQLNEEPYDAHALEARGIRCVNLEFPDCTSPPLHVVLEFLHTVERAAGAVAVHCKAGLGRTGTLVALYMMKHHGFSARAAMGWLRIVRPGSVIGEQQEFLCRMQAAREAELSAESARARTVEAPPTAAADDAAACYSGDCRAGGARGAAAGPPPPFPAHCTPDDSEEGRAEAAARQLAAALGSGGRTARRAAQARRASAGPDGRGLLSESCEAPLAEIPAT